MAWEVSLHPEVEAWYLAMCKSDPEAIPLADERFARHLADLEAEEAKKR